MDITKEERALFDQLRRSGLSPAEAWGLLHGHRRAILREAARRIEGGGGHGSSFTAAELYRMAKELR